MPLNFFKRDREIEYKGYKIKYLDTYSTFFKLNLGLKSIIFILKKIPLISYLGGRMIIVLEKNS